MILETAVGFTVREVPYEGEVGAGRLLPFEPRRKSASVAVPDDIPDGERLAIMRINGVSLVRVGIFDGDSVLVRKTYNRRSVGQDTVCVLYLRATGEIVAKKVTYKDDRLILHYCGLEPEPPIIVNASEVEFQGIIIGRTEHRAEWPFVDEPIQTITDGSGGPTVSPEERRSRLAALIKRFTKEEKVEELPF